MCVMRLVFSILFVLSALIDISAQQRETSGSCGPDLTWELRGTTIYITGSGPMNNFTTRYVGPDNNEDDEQFQEEQKQLTERQLKKQRRKELKARAKAKKKAGYVEDNFDHVIPWYHYNKYVTSVVVDEGVTTIGDNAFKGFEELKKVSLPSSIETIGRESFYWCVKLDTIKAPNVNLISIGAFSGCYGMRSVTIGKKLTTIEKSAFYQCKALRSVNYEGTMDDWFVIDFQSENSNPLKYAGHLYIDSVEVTEVNVPDTMTVIRPYVCMGMLGLQTLRMNEGVVKISSHSFDGCRSLNTIVSRPIIAPVLEKYAFLNTNIQYVYIPDLDSKESYKEMWGKRYRYYTNQIKKSDVEEVQEEQSVIDDIKE